MGERVFGGIDLQLRGVLYGVCAYRGALIGNVLLLVVCVCALLVECARDQWVMRSLGGFRVRRVWRVECAV